MMGDKLYFSTIKEARDEYFVEYQPPIHGFAFATLQLIFTIDVISNRVASEMEREASIWFERFPIPLMVSAFDSIGDLIHLDGIRPENHLLVFRNPGTGIIENHWRLLKNDEIPSDALKPDLLLKVYAEVGYQTSSELRAKAEKHARQTRIGWYVIFFWVAVAPAGFLIIEYFGPTWLAALVFVYSLFKAVVKALKMLGKWKKTPSEIAKEEEELRMRHHHYHCELNPKGFMRLKLENFQKEQKEKILREAESIKTETSFTG